VTASKGSLKERLSRYRQINLSVTGRKSGRTISIPVWFVLEGEKLYLLPVQGRSAFATRAFVTKREQKNKSAVLQAAITCLLVGRITISVNGMTESSRGPAMPHQTALRCYRCPVLEASAYVEHGIQRNKFRPLAARMVRKCLFAS